MKRWLVLMFVVILSLSACTVDENGVHSPLAEQAAQTDQARNELKSKQAENDRNKQQRELDLSIEREKLWIKFYVSLAASAAQTAPWLVLVGAIGTTIWLGGNVYCRVRKATIEATFAPLPVDDKTGTALAIITSNGWIVTPTGQQFRVGESAEPNMELAAIAAHIQETLILAQAAENISRHARSADPARDLPAIGAAGFYQPAQKSEVGF